MAQVPMPGLHQGARIQSRARQVVADRWARPKQAVMVFMFLLFGSTPCLLFGGARGGGTEQFGQSADSGSLFTGLVALCYLLAALGILSYWRTIMPVLARLWMVWVIVAYVAASTLWSIDPSLTATKSVALLGTTLVGLFVGISFSGEDQLKFLAIAMGLLIVLSLAMGVVAPGLAYDVKNFDGGHMLRGIFAQKNALGWVTSMTGIIALGAVYCRALPRWIGIGIWAASLVAAVASASATGLLVLLFGGAVVGILVLLRAARIYRLFVIIALIVAGIGVWLAWSAISAQIFSTFGKTETLSGRGLIWEALKPAIAARPFLGWGFAAFWDDPISLFYMRGAFWAGNAQGGYHELVISLGFVGLALYMTNYLVTLYRLYRRAMRGDRVALTFAAVLIALLLQGVTAPILLPVNIIFWVIIVMACTYVVRSGEAIERLPSRIRART